MNKPAHNKPLLGDWLIIITTVITIIFLFKILWKNTPASQLQIRQGEQVIGTYDLNQTRELHLHGLKGDSHISIAQGKVRFKQSPCNNQYCVHQGWLTRAGQVAICLPNQISLKLIGQTQPYDSLNY